MEWYQFFGLKTDRFMQVNYPFGLVNDMMKDLVVVIYTELEGRIWKLEIVIFPYFKSLCSFYWIVCPPAW